MIVTVAPAFTDSAENENAEIVITGPEVAGVDVAGADAVDPVDAAVAGVDSVDAGVEALEHDAIASATAATMGASARIWGCLMLGATHLSAGKFIPGRASCANAEILVIKQQ